MTHLRRTLTSAAVVGLPIIVLGSTTRPLDGQQASWDRLDTLAVLGGGPTWSEPPFYRVFDGILDNERNAVFLANGGDGELIRYDVGSGQIERIGRRGRGPGEFGRAESSVFNVFEESSDGWFRTGTLTLQGNVRILDASQDRVLFLHRDSLGQETVVVARSLS